MAGSAKLDYSPLFFVCGSNRTVTTTDMYTLDTDRMMKIFLHFAFLVFFLYSDEYLESTRPLTHSHSVVFIF